jgi:VCBS repeat protein/HYDIN/CFA65/VesB family protein
MPSQKDSIVLGFLSRILLFALFCGSLASIAAGQKYMYNQVALAAGNKPSSVVVADFNGDGRLDLALTNEGDNTVSILLSKPDGSFAPKVDYPVGNAPVQLISSDFNGDGKADLAVINSKDNTLSILLGVGDGTFLTQVTYPTGAMPIAITNADFNGDKHMDLAVANQTDGTISIFFGNPDGTFISQTPVVVAGTTPISIASGDLNGDGKPDLLLLSSGSGNTPGSLSLLTNHGNGTFASPSSLLTGSLGAMAVGDFNRDGSLDIAVTVPPSDLVYILQGNGTGSFQTRSLSVGNSLGAPAGAIVVGDFNHDGNLDLAISEIYFVAIYLGNGDGTFQPALPSGLPASPTVPTLAVGDFNNDGLPDLAIAIQDYNVALVVLGNGDGTLGSRADTSLPTSGGMGGSVAADLNGSGKQDLAIVQFNQPQQSPIQGFVTSLLGNGDATFQAPTSTPMSDIGIDGTVSADFNGDGHADIATASVDADGGLAVFLGTGSGTFGPPISSFVGVNGLNLGPMVAGDFNRDGKSDLVVVSEDNANNVSPMYVLLSQGDGTFKETFLYNLAYGFVPAIAAADFNHDGYLDLAVTSQNQLLVFLGKGDGSFAAPVPYSLNFAIANGVVAGDFNGDGKMDIVVGTSGAMLFFAGNGDGTFPPAPVSSSTPLDGVQMATGDFNGDGLLDLIMAGPASSDSVMLGNGDGTFQAPAPFQGTYYQRSFAVGDFNSDGTIDLVEFSTPNTSVASPQTATVWHSTPTISFTASTLQFAVQGVGTASSPKTLSFSNVGNAPLSVASIAAHGDFSESNTCPNTLAVGQGCTLQVTFTPTATGNRVGDITLTDNATPGTQTLALTGTAASPDFTLAAAPSSSTITAGSSTTFTLTLTPAYGFTGTVQVTCTGAPSEATCTPSPASASLDGSNTTTVNVSVSTRAASLAPLSRFSVRRWTSMRWMAENMVFWSALLCLSLIVVLSPRRHRCTVTTAAALLVSSIVIGGCGGGSASNPSPPPSNPGTPTGTYTLTLSTTGGTITHTATVTLKVN